MERNEAAAGEGGFLFEMNMIAVIGLRGLQLNQQNFQISSNTTGFGNFDDIVYTAGGHRYYLQLKHSNISDKHLEKREMGTLLKKCFQSYCEIINNQDENDETEKHFIIYTNRQLDPKLSSCKTEQSRDDIFFKTCDEGVFTFSENNGRNYVHKILENSLNNNMRAENRIIMIDEFLDKLVMVTGQKANTKLDYVISKEIQCMGKIKLNIKECKSVVYHFKTPLQNWWRSNKRAIVTPEMLRNWLQSATTEHFTPFVRGLINVCPKNLVVTGNRFSDSEISRLQTELSNKRAVHLRSDALTLCCILMQEWLKTSKHIFVTFESLRNNKDMMLYAWLEGDWERLVVFCEPTVQQSDLSDTCLNISEIIQCDPPTKRVIILTACSVQQITDFVTIEHEFEFEQLLDKSQKTVLEKKIDFQGWEVTMGDMLKEHSNMQHVLGPELVTELLTEETIVNIGGRLQNIEDYVHRTLQINIYLTLDVLNNPHSYPDIFVVSGMTEQELLNKIPPGESVGNELNSVTRFIVQSKEDIKNYFSDLCKIDSSKTLHRLKYKDGKLLWKQTCGRYLNVLNFIDVEKNGTKEQIVKASMKNGSCEINEEAIWNLGERTVLVVAEPGMGKSSTTTQVAWYTKLADPTSWVVRINWNDLTGKLQEINIKTFNFDSLVEFLCSAAFHKSKYTDINSSLLKEALQNSGNVTVLMDGFDEISPTHVHKALVILSELMKTKVGRVWVTSRPVQKKKLEEQLSVIAFSMKKLSHISQVQMFTDIWKKKANTGNEAFLNEYVVRFLRHTKNSVYKRNFTGCPLHIVMITTAFEEIFERSLQRKKISLPGKLKLLDVYGMFIERKLRIYETEKKREDLANACVQDDRQILEEIAVENLEKCSLLVTLPPELNPLGDEEIQSTIQPFVERLQAGKDKIGIVMNVVEERPQFVHRSIAEYCTARWFRKNFNSSRSVLESILFDSSYGIVKDVFDRILATGCPLHCAVLDRDTEAVEILLGVGHGVNAVDSGGRTAMHLIAAEECDRSLSEEITDSLLRHGTFVDAKDEVLQWTALRYAIKTENWFVVERLLQRKYKTADLELIRQRVDDESYMSKIIDDIIDGNYSLLLQYLASICANTQWAPLLNNVVARG